MSRAIALALSERMITIENGIRDIRGDMQLMKLTSKALDDGQQVDAVYTGDGEDVSPPLAWCEVPVGTQSFALICEDPDAPSPEHPAAQPWVHWVLYNIPADRSELPQGIACTQSPQEVAGAAQGQNSWPNDNLGYRGPAPPPGSGRHRYFFKLYALDTVLPLEAGATKQMLCDAISGHVLDEGQLFGTYER